MLLKIPNFAQVSQQKKRISSNDRENNANFFEKTRNLSKDCRRNENSVKGLRQNANFSKNLKWKFCQKAAKKNANFIKKPQKKSEFRKTIAETLIISLENAEFRHRFVVKVRISSRGPAEKTQISSKIPGEKK